MNKEIKEKWLAWLRDPANKQGRGQLRNDDEETDEPRYCCLGGLCELYKAEVGGEWHEEYFYDGSGDLNRDDLPESVANWAGINGIGSFPARRLPYHDGVGSKEGVSSLIHLNDELHWSFERIADFIEENF